MTLPPTLFLQWDLAPQGRRLVPFGSSDPLWEEIRARVRFGLPTTVLYGESRLRVCEAGRSLGFTFIPEKDQYTREELVDAVTSLWASFERWPLTTEELGLAGVEIMTDIGTSGLLLAQNAGERWWFSRSMLEGWDARDR